VETIRHADLVSFICLKALAFDQRFERKDAHDLVYCLENAERGVEGAAERFGAAREGKHGEVVKKVLGILEKRFATEGEIEGYRKDGPAAVAEFEIEGDDTEARERKALRQRDVNDIITRFLNAIGPS
jgi:hypothetical protein